MLSYRLMPFVATIATKTGRRGYLDRTILHPEETESIVPPAILPAGVDRITASDPHTTLDQQMAHLRRTEAHHAAVIRYDLGPAVFGPGGYASWSSLMDFSGDFRRRAMAERLTGCGPVDYLNTAVSRRYFGHWLRDGFSTALLAPEAAHYLTAEPFWQHAAEYEARFSLESLPSVYGHSPSLTIYQDHAQGSSKRARYAELRRRARSGLNGNGAARRVFLHRGASGARREIRDVDRFLEALERDGWTILETADASVDEIHERLFDAEIVAGVEGSQMNHAYFTMKADGALILLVPNDRFTTVHVGISRASGMKPGVVVMSGNQTEGYIVDYDEFRKTIDLALASRS